MKTINEGCASIFIDTDGYDEYEPIDYPEYLGISEFNVYDIPEEIDDNDEATIESFYSSRELYQIIGKATIGFTEDNEPEILRTTIKEKIQILYTI